MKDTCTIWVCQDCMLHHANGECGSCHMDDEGTWNGHDRKPWSKTNPVNVTMGMLDEQHDCIPDWDGSRIDCDCGTTNFSTSSCDGCGSNLAGERHAFTLWFED